MTTEATEPVTLPISEEVLIERVNKCFGTNATIKSYNCEIIGDGKGFMSIITKANVQWESKNPDGEGFVVGDSCGGRGCPSVFGFFLSFPPAE